MISMPNPIITASLLEDWEDSLTSQDSELWEEINDHCADFCNASPEEAQAFMDELADNGITTEQLVSSINGQSTKRHSTASSHW